LSVCTKLMYFVQSLGQRLRQTADVTTDTRGSQQFHNGTQGGLPTVGYSRSLCGAWQSQFRHRRKPVSHYALNWESLVN